MTVRGGFGAIQKTGSGTATLVNQGTIAGDTSGRTLYVRPDVLTNQGLIKSASGGNVTFATTFTNPGEVRSEGGSISVNVGTWTNTGLIGGTSGTVTLSGTNWTNEGTVDMTGALVINPTTWQNAGSIIFPQRFAVAQWQLEQPEYLFDHAFELEPDLGRQLYPGGPRQPVEDGRDDDVDRHVGQHGPRARSERQFQLVAYRGGRPSSPVERSAPTNPALAVNFDGNDANRLTDVTSNANLSLPPLGRGCM